MGLLLITPPTEEPVSLAEAKAHLRVLSSDEDTLIESLIVAAREYAEIFTGRAFITQTWEYTVDKFCSGGYEQRSYLGLNQTPIMIPKPKLQDVVSVKYIDGNSAEQTWDSSNYRVLGDGDRGKIVPVFGVYYPFIFEQLNAVTIRFIAGYGNTSSAVPQSIKQAMLLLIGHWFERRENSIVGARTEPIPLGVEELLWSHQSLVM